MLGDLRYWSLNPSASSFNATLCVRLFSIIEKREPSGQLGPVCFSAFGYVFHLKTETSRVKRQAKVSPFVLLERGNNNELGWGARRNYVYKDRHQTNLFVCTVMRGSTKQHTHNPQISSMETVKFRSTEVNTIRFWLDMSVIGELKRMTHH